MTGTMTHSVLLTRFHGKKTILLPRDGVPKDPYRRRHGPAEEGRMTPTLPPFLWPGSLQSPNFCWMLCVFYRIWFWPSADDENTKPDHDEKSLHRHTIPLHLGSPPPPATTRESLSSIDFTSLVLSKLSCWPYLVAKSLILCLRETHHLFPVTAPTNARLIRDSSRSRKSRISSKEVLNFQ